MWFYNGIGELYIQKKDLQKHLKIKVKKDFKEDGKHEIVVKDQFKIYNNIVIISITIF